MENASKIQQWYFPIAQRTNNNRPALLAGLGLVVVLGGLAAVNPLIGIACALVLLLLVLILPRPILIVYGLALALPLTGGIARGAGVPFLRVGQALLVVGFILFMLGRPGPLGKSRLTGIDLAFVLFFLTEAVFPVLALYYRGEHLNLNSIDYFNQGTPLQILLGPLQYYVLYRIVVATISSEQQIIVVLKLSFGASIIVSIIGILQELRVAPVTTLLNTYYPFVLQGDVISDINLRITSTLGGYGGLAAYLSFTIILALTCYTAQKGLKISPLFLATTLLFDSIALLLTGTFAGYFGLAVGAVIVFILLRRLPKLVIFVLAGIVLAALIFPSFISGRLVEWIGGSGQGLLPSYADRIRLWQELFLPSISQHLWFGAGPAPAATSYWPTEETQYLYLLDRGGLPYFFCYFLLFGVAIAACWRQIKRESEGISRTVAIATLAILVAISVMNVSGAFFTNAGGTQTIWILLAIVMASGQVKALGSLATVRPIAENKWVVAKTPLQRSIVIARAAALDGSRPEDRMAREKNSAGSYSLLSHTIQPKMSSLSRHRQRFIKLERLLDWRFVKDSVVVGAGSTIARILGLLFWILLARFLSPDKVGFVRYSTTLAPIIAIASAAAPISMARFLAVNRKDQRARDRYFSNGLVGVAILLAASLLISVPVLWLLRALNVGTILCIVGLTGFSTYFAVVRGMGDAWKMGLVYFLSNVMQMAVLLVVLGFFRLHTVTAALAVYGLTYLAPIALELIRPMTLCFRPSFISKDMLLEMARFALPVVVASGVVTIWSGIDMLLVENFNPQAAGSYAAAKTLSGAFVFVPAAITTVLMPRVAALELDKSKRYSVGGVLIALLASLIGLVIVAVWGRELIALTFGHHYSDAYLPLLVLSTGMSIFSVYAVVEGFLIGRGRPNFSVQAMLMALIGTSVTVFWLTSWLGTLGASLSFTFGALLGTLVILFKAWLFLRKEKQATSNGLSNLTTSTIN
jgi:O-antigen/teichoic acid export membrane protein